MTQEFERKVKYVQVVQNGQLVTHKVFDDMGRWAPVKKRKKKKLDAKPHYTTKNVNGKVITEITYDNE